MTFRRPAVRGYPRRLLVVFAATFVAVFCFAGVAAAQSITVVNETSLPRLTKDDKPVRKRPTTLTPEGVSLQDCIDDQKIQFTLQMADFAVTGSVQAWASIGQDCKPSTARGGGVTTCWPVYDAAIPLAAITDVRIPVRKIMSGAPPFTPPSPDASEAVCGKVDLANIGVQFLYFAPGDPSNAAFAKSVSVTVDTVGPLPPSGLTVQPGDTRIHVKWTNISGGDPDAGATGGVTELTGVKVYCDRLDDAPDDAGAPAPAEPECHDEPIEAGPDADADADAGDAGTVEVCEDAGTTTPAPTGGACTSSNFVKEDGSPVFPTAEFDKQFGCGSVTGNTGTSVVADTPPLVNGARYAVAIAATDKFGNAGELSQVVCEVPEETTDFWDEYRRAGGGAGGCTTNGADAPLGSITAVFAGLALAISSLVRRRSRR